ncbi:MAG: hypothetical protein HQM10_19370 [Candidatus Riflebacteria bacterium]|nr:hypothetical protein [Candidatus Riflebacteria bacterium]
MRSAIFLMLLFCQIFSSQLLLAGDAISWKIKYGESEEKLAFQNSRNTKVFIEASALGPQSFRIIKNELWIADSLNGRILSFGSDGSLKKHIKLSDMASNTYLEDFAFSYNTSGKPEILWVADAADLTIRKIDLASSREISRIKGDFVQINQLETDSRGRLYVGDYGKAAILVLSSDGSLIRSLPWQLCGFTIGKDDSLTTIEYSENLGYFIVQYNSEGKKVNDIHIGRGSFQNGRIWFETDDSYYISFIPSGGFRGTIYLERFSRNGKFLSKVLLKPRSQMNRFLSETGKEVYFADTDFSLAPDELFKVVSIADFEKSEKPGKSEKKLFEFGKELILRLKGLDLDKLVGMRTKGREILVFDTTGAYLEVNPDKKFFKPKNLGRALRDFAVSENSVICITGQGDIFSDTGKPLIDRVFDSQTIEYSESGDLFLGGSKNSFCVSASNTSEIIDLKKPLLSVPLKDSFMWSVERHPTTGVWQASIVDIFGNSMKRVFRFSRDFEPSNIRLLKSPENDLLVSYWSGSCREIALIGQNSRMFWKIELPEPICQRDIAFDDSGNLLLLEREKDEILLYRLRLSIPQG